MHSASLLGWICHTCRRRLQRSSKLLKRSLSSTTCRKTEKPLGSSGADLSRTRNIGIIAHIDAVSHQTTGMFEGTESCHRARLRRLSVCSIIVAILGELEVNLDSSVQHSPILMLYFVFHGLHGFLCQGFFILVVTVSFLDEPSCPSLVRAFDLTYMYRRRRWLYGH